MLFLIPHLFPNVRLLEAATQDLHLPALQILLARGSRQACPADGVEAAVCEALGIERQQDWPVAPMTLEADGGVAGEAFWLRADPVHLQVMRDRIVLGDSRALGLSQAEADALSAAIAQHFGEELSPLPLHPGRWYQRLPSPPSLLTTPLSVATGRAIAPLLPQGEDAPRFRSLLNEVQMLLHEHPVNLAREARGDLPVNSLWLWGGGRRPAVLARQLPIYTQDSEARALGAFCRTDTHPLPARLEMPLLEQDGMILLDQLAAAGQHGEAHAWREALRVLEQDWFMPLRDSLRASGPHGLRLLDPDNGKALLLQQSDAWKIWRRPQSLISALA